MTPIDADRIARLLSGYIAIDTSNPPGFRTWPRRGDLPEFAAYLLEHWVRPLELEYRFLSGDNLAIFVSGRDQRRPVIQLSHADVVPVDPVDRERWSHPPFAGDIDEFVWGRGALDNKASAVMYLEAVRLLLERGDRPSRSLVILVTVDEEVGGSEGSLRIVEDHLPELGDPEVVLDEGGALLPDFAPGVLVGVVAVAEKTFATIRGGSGEKGATRRCRDLPPRPQSSCGLWSAWSGGGRPPGSIPSCVRPCGESEESSGDLSAGC